MSSGPATGIGNGTWATANDGETATVIGDGAAICEGAESRRSAEGTWSAV